MEYLLEGIQYGLVLAIMTGPIFFALLQVSVEEGVFAGIVVGLGIWISDLLFILAVSLGIQYLFNFSIESDATKWTGIAGSLILVGFGLGTMLKKPPPMALRVATARRHSSIFTLWAKGFLINTINPFTFLFWIGISSAVIVKNELDTTQTNLFFIGIMTTIIATDTLKVFLSKQIRQCLKPKHLILLRYISGSALILFGIAIIVRVFWLQ